MTPEIQDSRPARRPKRHGVLTGLIIIAVGLAFLGERLGLESFHHVWRQWPLLLIILGAARLLERGPLHLGGQALVFVGVFFELGHLGYPVTLHWWPLIVVWIGVMLTLRALRPAHVSSEHSHD
jgi:hypothetical protein